MQYGCIGGKLSHSFSKIIHNDLCDYEYELKEIPRDKLDSFMKQRDFKAINVTIPYKQDVIPYLDFISDTAKSIGAVNTVVNNGGYLYGYNTDFSGMTALIKRNNIGISSKKVLVLGSGGTSKTAVAVANSLGALSVYRVSRSGNDGAITYEQAYYRHRDAQIIINTTPCGMYPNIGKSAVDISRFSSLSGVVDAVYNPLKSQLVVEAQKAGIPAIGGLYMLVAQAAFAVEKFTAANIPTEETERVYKKMLKSKENIVLIGMPGCGKTTIGKAVAEELNMSFIDTDDEIVKEAGKDIPRIFDETGEDGFRELESKIIYRISAVQGAVIATGGGAILRQRNIDLLKENGIIVFIDRPLEKLVTTDNRPLSKTRELLKKRYDERYGIYKKAADITVKADDNLRTNITEVKREFTECEF